MNDEDSDDNEEMGEAHVPQRKFRGPAVELDSRMWLNLVKVKPPYLADLEIESMKRFILNYKRNLRNVRVNCHVICNNLSWRNIWTLL